jgi:cbb3-type cytochrome oxidase subunit 3
MELDLHDQAQIYLGTHEREIHSWLERLSKGVGTAMDIGAADGEYTLYFLLKSQARIVIAYEPSKQARKQLARNLELNHCATDPRLMVLPHFVGSRDHGLERTVDSLLSRLQPPCLIKVDVDGGELEVLRGAPKTLASGNVCWIIETHSHQLERQCHDILARSGLATAIVDNAWWRLILPEMRPIPHNRWLIGYPPADHSSTD